MKLDTNEILAYSVAIGILNLVLTAIIWIILSLIFKFPFTLKNFGESYLIGYVVLWVLNITTIRQ